MPSNVYSVPTQYYNGSASAKKFESYNVALKAVVVDTKPYPKSGCANYTLGDGTKSKVCLTKAQIQKKLKAVIADKHFPTGLGTNYFLFTPQGVASCKTKALATGGLLQPVAVQRVLRVSLAPRFRRQRRHLRAPAVRGSAGLFVGPVAERQPCRRGAQQRRARAQRVDVRSSREHVVRRERPRDRRQVSLDVRHAARVDDLRSVQPVHQREPLLVAADLEQPGGGLRAAQHVPATQRVVHVQAGRAEARQEGQIHVICEGTG